MAASVNINRETQEEKHNMLLYAYNCQPYMGIRVVLIKDGVLKSGRPTFDGERR